MSKIITSSDLSTYMTKTLDDGVAQNVVDAMNAWIENRTGRCFGETRTITERYDWAPHLWLRHQDVQSIQSINFGYPNQQQTALNSSDYFFSPLGRVTMYISQPRSFNPSPINNDLVEVAYTYGVDTCPDDLKLAALGIGAGFYNWATTGQKEVVATSVGSYRLQFIGSVRGSGTGQPNPANNTSDANWAIVDSYRTRKM